MSNAPVVKYVETHRDEKWIYGDRFVDDEFSSKWIEAVTASFVPVGGYGLPLYEADILVRDKHTADYFEALVYATTNPSLSVVWLFPQLSKDTIIPPTAIKGFLDAWKERPTPTQCAKFIINELMAGAKRSKVELNVIPVSYAAILLLHRINRLLSNQQIKGMLDEHLKATSSSQRKDSSSENGDESEAWQG